MSGHSSSVATQPNSTFANPIGQGVPPATSTTGNNNGVGTAANGVPIGNPGSGPGSPENPR
jgi:hypothetical protein